MCLLLVASSPVLAFDDEPTGWAPAYIEEQPDNWLEQEGELPAYPEKGNLLEVDAGTEGLQYTVYLDKPSLVKGDDGVVSYTVVLVSGMLPMRACIAANAHTVVMPTVLITSGNR